jgi:hypothetical protein
LLERIRLRSKLLDVDGDRKEAFAQLGEDTGEADRVRAFRLTNARSVLRSMRAARKIRLEVG